MKTRRAAPGSELSQERWASSPAIERGLLANLVAKRLEGVADQEFRGLIWWLQSQSWKPGGLERIGAKLLAAYPKQVADAVCGLPLTVEECEEEGFPRCWAVQGTPSSKCLADDLSAACCDPEWQIKASWVDRKPMFDLVARIRSDESAEIRAATAQTKLVGEMWESLELCANLRSCVLIEGLARTGKSTAARAWCESSGGRGRYVATPQGNDLDALVRGVASAIGSAAGLSFKARQVEERVFRALPGSGLTLVFDDAQLLWPQGDIRQSHPKRLQWLLALIETGVPVALVVTPQWWDSRREFVAQTGWAVDQLEGRLARVVTLDSKLGMTDCRAIAKAILPDASEDSWEILAELAASSRRRLGAIEGAIAEAGFIARQAGRTSPNFADLQSAAMAALATDAKISKEAGPAPKAEASGTDSRTIRGSAPAGIQPGAGRGSAGILPQTSFGSRVTGLRGADSPSLERRV